MKNNKRTPSILIFVSLFICSSLSGCSKKIPSYYDNTIRKTYKENDPVFVIGKNNNGVTKYGEDIDFLLSAKPDERLLKYHELGGYYNFIHFGINTFTNREWGTGKEDLSIFNPKKLNTDQWCSSLKASGSAGVILTVKHHDGFCLYPSEYTDFDISSTPYKNGEGDILKELSLSCQKYDMKLGIYLSPWDMHEPSYGTNAYNTYFINQLKEVLNKDKYGDIFEVWFDGARGEVLFNPGEDFSYDFNHSFKLRINNFERKFSIKGLDYSDSIVGIYQSSINETITLNKDGTCSFIGGSFGNEIFNSSYIYDEDNHTITFLNVPNSQTSLTASMNESYFGVVRKYQPDAVISVIGPDIRWVGNEEGIMNENEWSIRGRDSLTEEDISSHSQHSSDDELIPSTDIVSRNSLLQHHSLVWTPVESDVKNRDSWFYHKKESPKSVKALTSLYYRNVGYNGNLLLNVPPNRDGLIDGKDIKVLKQFGEKIKNDFSKPISYTAKIGDNESLVVNEELNNKINNQSLGTGYQFTNSDYIIDLDFDSQKDIRNILISEDITHSQRIEDYSLYLKKSDGSFLLISHKETIGNKRIIALDPKKNNKAVGIRFTVNQSRDNPVINYIGIFEK